MVIEHEELTKRRWPSPAFPVGHEVAGRRGKSSGIVFYDDSGREVVASKPESYSHIPTPDSYLDSCYVKAGKIVAIPLDKNILPGESGITCLTKGRIGEIFGGTSGEKAHLFVYDAKDQQKRTSCVDLGVVQENSTISGLVTSADGKVFLGTNPKSEGGHIFCYDSEDKSMGIRQVVSPVKGEGISALSIDNNSGRIYGVSNRRGIFFVFYLDSGKVELKGQVDKDELFSEVLAVAHDGDVFGGMRWGQFFKYKVSEERLIPLEVKAPCIQGREVYNKIDSLTVDEGGHIYGGTSADGILFRFNLLEDKVISLGKPLNQPRIRCLTLGGDGAVYGIAGKDCCHLFRYDPKDGHLQDLGILYVSSPRYWHGYEFDAAVTGENGEIYLGQDERISYLFVYCPAIPER